MEATRGRPEGDAGSRRAVLRRGDPPICLCLPPPLILSRKATGKSNQNLQAGVSCGAAPFSRIQLPCGFQSTRFEMDGGGKAGMQSNLHGAPSLTMDFGHPCCSGPHLNPSQEQYPASLPKPNMEELPSSHRNALQPTNRDGEVLDSPDYVEAFVKPTGFMGDTWQTLVGWVQEEQK